MTQIIFTGIIKSMLNKIIFIALVIAASLGAGAYFSGNMKLGVKDPVTILAQDELVVMRTKGGLLEVSSIVSPETFEQATAYSAFGINLGKSIARIRVPATYRYHVELAPEWRFIRRDKTFVVIAPAVKPSLPVAIDTAKLEGETSGKWSIINGAADIAALQKSITAGLSQKASSQKYIDLQREHARKTVTEFVEKWVLNQDKWKIETGYSVRVFFADEPVEKIQSSGFFPVPLPSGKN